MKERKKNLYRYYGAVYNGSVVYARVDIYLHAFNENQALKLFEERVLKRYQIALFLDRDNVSLRRNNKPKLIFVEFIGYLSEIYTELWKDKARGEYYGYYNNKWYKVTRSGDKISEYSPDSYFNRRKYPNG